MRPLDPNFDQNIFVNNYQFYNKKETIKNIARYLIAALICLTAALYVGTASAQAPAKHLPDTVRVKLPVSELMAISAKIDSMQTALIQTSNLPSAWLQSFMQRVNATLYLLYKQVNDQMVADKVKAIPATHK